MGIFDTLRGDFFRIAPLRQVQITCYFATRVIYSRNLFILSATVWTWSSSQQDCSSTYVVLQTCYSRHPSLWHKLKCDAILGLLISWIRRWYTATELPNLLKLLATRKQRVSQMMETRKYMCSQREDVWSPSHLFPLQQTSWLQHLEKEEEEEDQITPAFRRSRCYLDIHLLKTLNEVVE